mmetsp:Transcript_43334/g.101650  ORF Transcript_43334/g.101650 Transcript_43334/m.101650 type:complete len:401 (+) Transcript_43334:1672-2874(+)
MSETVRAFDGVLSESAKYSQAQGNALEYEEFQAWAYGFHKMIVDNISALLKCFVLFTVWKVGKGGMISTEAMTNFLFYVTFTADAATDVGDQWAKIQSAFGASGKVFELLERKPLVMEPYRKEGQASISKDESAPIIKISDMTVSYNALSKPALDHVNLDIYPGDKVSIIGRSGSGKSTVLRTMLRFYDPSTGACSLMGNSLRDLTRSEISKDVTVVEQEPHLFPLTVVDNVLYGIEKDDINKKTGEPTYSQSIRDAAANALDQAGLSTKPGNDLGLSLDTRVGEGGRTLSGGQRSRLAIARALVRNPTVLLLDEPTAALDSKSESKVISALQKATQKTRTMVLVTHRLNVIRSLGVNKIVILSKGKIIEQGDPEVLLRDSNSVYASMAREQNIEALDAR